MLLRSPPRKGSKRWWRSARLKAWLEPNDSWKSMNIYLSIPQRQAIVRKAKRMGVPASGAIRGLGTATALTNCTVMRIEKKAMLKALHSQHEFSDMFVEHLLAKNFRYREDLIDQLFNSSEKRLARILLLFAGFGKDGIRERTEIPKVSQATLAEMVGTTRSRVSSFMNKFRRLGFIYYNGGLEIHSSLLTEFEPMSRIKEDVGTNFDEIHGSKRLGRFFSKPT